MKKGHFIFGAMWIVVIIMMFFTNKRINNIEGQLKAENQSKQESEEKIQQESEKEIKQEIVLQGEYAEFVQAIFPFKGEYYVEISGTITFYSDIECTEEITNTPRFLSYNQEYITIGNRQIYAYLLDNGQICYSKGDQLPTLLRESDYYNYYIKSE